MLFIEEVICTKMTVVATVIVTIACNITIVLPAGDSRLPEHAGQLQSNAPIYIYGMILPAIKYFATVTTYITK